MIGAVMPKPFRTIEEQVDILRSRGMYVPDSAKDTLLAENYYSVVNGYKEFFIDKKRSCASPEEVYIEGTSFSDLYDLFLFDRDLRELTFHYLLRAEAIVKTVSVYTFCENFPEPRSYLDMENYTTRDEYMLGEEYYIDDLPDLINKLRRKAYTQAKCKGFIQHYRDKHKDVPLWVLSNDLTFGNISYFFNLQRRGIQSIICRRIVQLRHDEEKKYLAPHELRMGLRSLVEFRNICAHDERLFCARVGPVEDIRFADMISALRLILTPSQIDIFLDGIIDIIEAHPASKSKVKNILNEMG